MARFVKNSSSTTPTGRSIAQILPGILKKMGQRVEERPDLIIAAWAEVIGQKLAPMAQAVSFEEGTLAVKVKNSTLLSLLSQHEKRRLLKALQDRFPQTIIRNIMFRIG